MRRRNSMLGAAAITLLLIAFTGAAWAQPPEIKGSTPEQRAKAQTAFMKTKLELTEEQLPKVEALNLKYALKLEPVIKGSSAPLAKVGEMQAANQQKEAELKEILTPDQLQKYLASQDEMREKVLSDLRSLQGAQPTATAPTPSPTPSPSPQPTKN